jgi:chromatin segregation and condensation protein Rec8/ScpA/Scc1 (kleisin family)
VPAWWSTPSFASERVSSVIGSAVASGRSIEKVAGRPTGPRGGEVTALAAAWTRVLALASRTREEEQMAPGERYSVEDRTSEIELIVGEHGEVTFTELLGPAPTLGWAVVTFIALLDLYRRIVIDLEQNELFTDIVIRKKERPTPMTEAPA